MKISFITGAFSATGGVGRYSVLLANALHHRGHTIQVIHDDKAIGEAPLSFSHCYAPGFSDYGTQARLQNKTVLESLELFSPDIVHVQASMNYSLENEIRARFCAVKSLHVYDFCPSGTKYHYATQKACIHKPGLMCVPRMVYKRCALDKNPETLWMFYRRAMDAQVNDAQYSKLLVASDYVRDQALQAGHPEAQLEVLPYFAPAPQAFPKPHQKEKILMATGRMVLEKGFSQLIDALALLNKNGRWRAVFDGHGPELKKLKAKTEKLGLETLVEFPGWLPADKHEELYQNAFAVIVPSIWPEPFGLVGIEAMSYGKPVIAFRSGGIPGWLEDKKNGFLVPAGNVQLLSESISELLATPDTARKMGNEGLELFQQHFNEEAHVQRLLALYEACRKSVIRKPVS